MPEPRPAGHLRRTWPQRLLLSFNACIIVVALLTAGSLAYAKRTVSQIRRTTTAPGLLKAAEDLKPGEPENFLIVGVDNDDGLAADDPARAGRDEVTGLRSDTIMVVRIDPKTKAAEILSFPRDLWVDIPGEGSNRINAAVAYGDGTPNLLIRTIRENFGIDISHYVQVDLAGFQGLVRVLDGIPIWFDTPVRDQSGLDIEDAGCTRLDEYSALNYVRSRHFKHYDEERGRWVGDAQSDLARIDRQQDFVRRVIARAIKQGWRNPTKLVSFVNLGVQNITLDEVTTPQDLISLGKRFRNFDPDALETYSLPVTDTFRGGAAVLDLDEEAAQPVLDRFRGPSSSGLSGDIVPAEVEVQVLNGTGKSNQAATTADGLQAAGFTTRSPGSTASVARTEVRYRPGEEAAAVLVARYLGADPTLVPDADIAAGEVTVVTGPDFFAARTTPRPAGEITTTSTTTTTTTAPANGGSPTTTSTLGGAGETPGRAASGYLPGDPPAGQSCS